MLRGVQDMDSKKTAIDNSKLAAAFSKLQANPETLRPVEDALNSMITKLNLGLNQHETQALVKEIFTGQEARMGDTDPPSYSSCTVRLLAYECTSCPHPAPPAYTVKTC